MDKFADNLLEHFPQEIKKYDFSKGSAELAKILTENEGKPITKELVESLHKNISNGLDKVVSDSLKRDLDLLLPQDKNYKITDNSVKAIQDTIREVLKPIKLPENIVERIIPNAQTLTEEYTSKGLLNGTYNDFTDHSKVLQTILTKNIEDVSSELDEQTKRRLQFNAKKIVHSQKLGKDSPLFEALKLEPAEILTPEKVKTIKAVSDRLNTFKAESAVLDRYAYIKVAQAPETGLANIWNHMSDEIFKAMNFTQDEIKQARIDNEIATEILRNKMESIVANKVHLY